VIASRYYNAKGVKWEARFFHKGDVFPDGNLHVPRQGVWARPVDYGWESAIFVGYSWQVVHMDTDLLHLPERKRAGI
jgi:hypothetical protein